MKTYIAELRDIRSRSLSSAIYRQLEEMILSGRIRPGERINESQLAAVLQVSRAPIREACRQLEKHGMVEVRERCVRSDEKGNDEKKGEKYYSGPTLVLFHSASTGKRPKALENQA